MKILSKIAVFVGLVAFMSSCQKEELPSPSTRGGCTHQENAASTQKVVDPADKPTSVAGPAITGKEEGRTDADEIVGGGDDDRNGGGDGKKEKKR